MENGSEVEAMSDISVVQISLRLGKKTCISFTHEEVDHCVKHFGIVKRIRFFMTFELILSNAHECLENVEPSYGCY